MKIAILTMHPYLPIVAGRVAVFAPIAWSKLL